MRRLTAILIACICWSCQEEVTLPLATIDGVIPVIEATWTDASYYNEVKVTLAENYFDTTDVDIISDAQVTIRGLRSGVTIPFSFNDDTQSFKPINDGITAKVGELYQISVEWEDKVFMATGEMLMPPTVDSLTYQYQEKRIFRDEGYYIKVYGKIPFEEDNYYRIKVIENDTLKNDRDDYLLFDDTFGLTFFEDGLELNYSFDEGDKVRLELFRMNKSAYDYLTQIVGLLYNDGGLFSPPPQNPETNFEVISGDSEVFGFFMVSPVLTETIFIENDD